jgi:serine/threonine protein kinase
MRCPKCAADNADRSRFCGRCGATLDATPGDPFVGQLIGGRYRVDRVIGEGGMGRVYYAEQQLGKAKRAVALKVLHAAQSQDPTLRQRFYRECELVVTLSHPNTIQFYDFGELEDGRLYIVMELIAGRSLAQAIAEGPLPLARVERIAVQMAGSLGEAHARGIVHRDLKPDNILLSARGGEPDFVKVCDFGIAKHVDPAPDAHKLTLQGTLIGTPRYMSPEQLTGGDVDARSDIYSVGLILYEALTGRPPFQARSAMEWAAKHTTADPEPFEAYPWTARLPDATKRAVLRALEKLPNARQQTVGELAAELMSRGEAPALSVGPVVITPSSLADLRPVDVSAPTLHAGPAARDMRTSHASPGAMRRDAPSPSPSPTPGARVVLPSHTSSEMLSPAPARGGFGTFAWIVAVLGALIGAAGVSAFFYRDRLFPAPRPSVPAREDAGLPIDAGLDGGGTSYVARAWFRIVLEQEETAEAANALGSPDHTYAQIRPRGSMVLETPAGARLLTDGGPGPDLVINVDDVASGRYRVEVGVKKGEWQLVGSQLVGSMTFDLDPFGEPRIRYVRITNRGTRNVYVDSAGAYRTVVVDTAQTPAGEWGAQ